MKQILFSRSSLAFILAFGIVFGLIIFADKNDLNTVRADMTAQTIPFSQDWSNAGLLTTDDDWSGVPGIVGFRGDGLATGTNADPRDIVADGSGTPQDARVNRDDPSTFTSGGIAEFDGIADPTVALQGSGTADVPHLVIYLNTTGQSNIRVQYNARDIDDQTNNDATQQINTQYRVGGSGDYTNVTGGYIADATTDGQNDVNAVDVTLPADANNQSLVEVRVMTTNAGGSDEWIGIDDINITAGAAPPTANGDTDFDGDGTTDYAVVRDQTSNGNLSGKGRADKLSKTKFDNLGNSSAGTDLVWYSANSGENSSTFNVAGLGKTGDKLTPADFDGDGKDDFAVWRAVGPSGPGGGFFYILKSSDSTVETVDFGQAGDEPNIVGDYDGDGKADPAVFRQSGAQTLSNVGGTTFPGTGVGAIPDGSCGTDDLTVTFAVSGLSGSASNIDLEISFEPNHTWAGDLDIFLESPDGTSHVIQSFTGGQDPNADGGDSSNLSGPYTFSDTATNNWWSAAAAIGGDEIIPSGSYRTQAAGPSATDDPGPDFTEMTAAFSNIPTLNGDWKMIVGDCANFDTGGVASANLIITEDSAPTGGPTTFFYKGSAGGGETTYVPWGDNSTEQIRPIRGDYDGDGKHDFVVYRTMPGTQLVGGSQGQYAILRSSDLGVQYVTYGLTSDTIHPGDYDGDGMYDFMHTRFNGNSLEWYLLEADGGGNGAAPTTFGANITGFTEFPAPGDYDGDGKDDIAVWRRDNNDSDNCFYYILRSSDGMLQTYEFGASNDVPVQGWDSQ